MSVAKLSSRPLVQARRQHILVIMEDSVARTPGDVYDLLPAEHRLYSAVNNDMRTLWLRGWLVRAGKGCYIREERVPCPQ